ncbi:hypothetical protein [Streptomyces werraensis]|uniref:hypothetical protein n=1 Tax=Streptomyces werraensis TaxID=68284 RepID=UPI0037D8BF74
MPSSAYLEWSGERRKKIDELFSVHASVGGTGPGRRWRTSQLNWSITLRLAGEFQGFARDLHDEASDALCDPITKLDPSLSVVLRSSLSRARKLDKGNAQPAALGNDFSYLGLSLWPALKRVNVKAGKWNDELESLNIARNAIAHDDQDEFLKLQQRNRYPITLDVVKRWSRALDGLAVTMDAVVGDYLAGFLGGQRPW